MITKTDLQQMFRTEFGHYPSTQEYMEWLEERELKRLNEKPAFKTTFERQMEILEKHSR
jgi:hypothetical protein